MRLIIALIVFSFAFLHVKAQSTVERFKQAIIEKEYVEALSLTSQVISENPNSLELLGLAADVYVEMEYHAEAVKVLQAALEIESNNVIFIRKYALALANTSKFTDAVNMMNKLFKKKGMDKNPDNLVALANIYLKADSLAQAEYTLLKARESDDKRAEIFTGLGDLYYAKKVYELAKDNYESAILLNKELLEPRIKLASSYYRLGNMEMDQTLSQEYFRRSLNEWNYITKVDPKNATAFYEQGKIFFLASKFLEAGSSFNRYALLRPEGWLGRWYCAQAWYKSKRFDSAVVHLEAVRNKIDTITVQANEMLAHSYFETKKYKESSDLYGTLSKIDQANYERYGYAAFFAKDTNTAVKAFYSAIEGPEKKCNTIFRFANLLMSMKKYDEAINVFSKRINMCDDTNSVKSLYYIGNCLYLSAKHDSAIIVFKDYLTKEINSIPARISMYNSFNALKKSDAGKQYLTEAYQIYANSILENPNNAATKKEGESVLDALCRINLESKEFASVIKYAKEWSDINKNSATPYVYLGFAYQSQNDSQNACKNYNEALKLDPSNVAASKNKKALLCK